MRRNHALEATIVDKYAGVKGHLDERGRRIWAATESRAIGHGGDALVSAATELSRPTIRAGRRELESGGAADGRTRRPGAGRPGIERSQPGIGDALEKLVDPMTRGDPESLLRWTCKSRAKLAEALSEAGWRAGSTTVGRLLHERGCSLQSVRKSRRDPRIRTATRSSGTSTRRPTTFSGAARRWCRWTPGRRSRWATSGTAAGSGSRRATRSGRWSTTSRRTRPGRRFRTASATWRATRRG